MNPAGQVTWGQKAIITCSISAELFGGTFVLEKTSGSFRESQTSHTNSATFNIFQVNFDHEGLYRCQYEKSISSQTVSSPLSDSMRLSVTGKEKKNQFPELDISFTCVNNQREAN